MASLYTHQSSNIAKTWGLMIGFFFLVIAVGWCVAQYFGEPFFLIIAVGFSIVMNITAYWFSDRIALSSAHAHEADAVKYLELHRVVENLAITAGLPKPRVYLIEDSAPNAFAAGRNPAHSVVAVTTGLLAQLDRGELEGVIAHELAHIGNRDILVMTVAVVLAGFLSVLADMFLRMSSFGGGDRDRGVHPAIMVVGVVGILLAPIAAQLIQFSISRKREFLADASGVLLTRYPEGLANALKKISAHGAPVQHATSATAHLYIANPFGAQNAGTFMRKIFSTHPPIEERIAALTQMRV
jgi:heat shock protein HtpX